MTVQGLVNPSGIAIVGASERRYYARSIISNLLSGGFEESRLFPVHPRHAEVLGLTCYGSMTEIPSPVSLAVIATNASTVPDLIEEAGRARIESAVVLADGYAEQGESGRRRQQDLAAVALRSGVRILGPNTLGFVAPPEGVVAWAPGELSGRMSAGSVGVVFQSSGMLNLFLDIVIGRKLGLRAAFSVGNEISYDTADFISFLVQDSQTEVITLLLETSSKPRRLVNALQEAQAAGKPVVALKLGASARAQANAIAHTGRMAGSGEAWEALLRRMGVILAEDLDELVEATALLQHFPAIGREEAGDIATRVGFVTVSGGDCSLLADMAERLDLPLADLAPATLTQLRRVLEKPDLLGNPLDTENLAREKPAAFRELVDTFCWDENVDVVAFRMYLPATPTENATSLYKQLIQQARDAGKRPVVLTRALEQVNERWYEFFADLQTPFLPSYRPGLRSMALVTKQARARASSGKVALHAIPTTPTPTAEGVVADWHRTQRIVNGAKVRYVPSRFAVSAEEAIAAAGELGYPVAVKMISGDVPHKSDVGGVELGLASSRAVAGAVHRILTLGASIGAEIEGFEIQAMAPTGVEMILGVARDATLGPTLMIGMGGVLAELTRDVVLLTPDVEPDDVDNALRSLAGGPLLRGYRGRPVADVGAFCEMVASLSTYVAEAEDDLLALDLNPVFVLENGAGAIAVDALAVVRPSL